MVAPPGSAASSPSRLARPARARHRLHRQHRLRHRARLARRALQSRRAADRLQLSIRARLRMLRQSRPLVRRCCVVPRRRSSLRSSGRVPSRANRSPRAARLPRLAPWLARAAQASMDRWMLLPRPNDPAWASAAVPSRAALRPAQRPPAAIPAPRAGLPRVARGCGAPLLRSTARVVAVQARRRARARSGAPREKSRRRSRPPRCRSAHAAHSRAWIGVASARSSATPQVIVTASATGKTLTGRTSRCSSTATSAMATVSHAADRAAPASAFRRSRRWTAPSNPSAACVVSGRPAPARSRSTPSRAVGCSPTICSNPC